jgi:hypothetical protein
MNGLVWGKRGKEVREGGVVGRGLNICECDQTDGAEWHDTIGAMAGGKVYLFMGRSEVAVRTTE